MSLRSQISLPWKTLCIPHRFEPRSADRRRGLHTQRSSPRFHLGFLTLAIGFHRDDQGLAPWTGQGRSVQSGEGGSTWIGPGLVNAVDPSPPQTLIRMWRKRAHVGLTSPQLPSILDWVRMTQRLSPSWMPADSGTRELKETRWMWGCQNSLTHQGTTPRPGSSQWMFLGSSRKPGAHPAWRGSLGLKTGWLGQGQQWTGTSMHQSRLLECPPVNRCLAGTERRRGPVGCPQPAWRWSRAQSCRGCSRRTEIHVGGECTSWLQDWKRHEAKC